MDGEYGKQVWGMPKPGDEANNSKRPDSWESDLIK